ncbi:hypothetical protein V7S43_015334 [Phytophthora oleae]|uniref:Pectate lyase n=1 Tax=Phytophthora oleae TaxID=2107226 RepID=A0ABD3F3G3_9STRA
MCAVALRGNILKGGCDVPCLKFHLCVGVDALLVENFRRDGIALLKCSGAITLGVRMVIDGATSGEGEIMDRPASRPRVRITFIHDTKGANLHLWSDLENVEGDNDTPPPVLFLADVAD